MQWVRLVAAADYKDLDGWHVAEHATLLLYYMALVLAGVSGQRSVQSGRFLYVAIAGRGLSLLQTDNNLLQTRQPPQPACIAGGVRNDQHNPDASFTVGSLRSRVMLSQQKKTV